jgi:hypothetical protein
MPDRLPRPAPPPLPVGRPLPVDRPERRRHPRRSAGDLPGRIGFAQRLRLLDLSSQGARITTEESLAPGRRYHFQLAGIHVTAEVARCALVAMQPDEEGARPLFEAGIVFDALTPAQRRDLRQAASVASAGADSIMAG